MEYEVRVKRGVLKKLHKLPMNIQDRFENLVQILHHSGPTGAHVLQNYSKLSETEYHCHLTYSYVACWRLEKNTIIIEVYYVGSREDAPY